MTPYMDISEHFADILSLVQLKAKMYSLRLEGNDSGEIQHEICSLERTISERNLATLDNGRYTPLEHICKVFEASPFERHCILMAAAIEIDRVFEDIYRSLMPRLPSGIPSLELALKLYSDDFKEYLKALLMFTKRRRDLSLLFELDESMRGISSHLSLPLKLKKQVVNFMMNASTIMEDVPHTLFLPDEELNACLLDEGIPSLIAAYLEKQPGKIVFILEGEAGSGRKFHIKRFSALCGVPVLFVESRLLLATENADPFIKNICLEAKLQQAVICLVDIFSKKEEDDTARVVKIRGLLFEIFRYTELLFITAAEIHPEDYQMNSVKAVTFKMSQANAAQRRKAWRIFTEKQRVSAHVDFTLFANRYGFSLGLIHDAAHKAAEAAAISQKTEIGPADLNEACKKEITDVLGRRVRSVKAQYCWDELILPEQHKKALRDACNQVRYRNVVYEDWNFRRKMRYGTGLSMLFTGPPGTGKTMAAQVMANELSMDIYQVELSGLVSKYIGETEKNLAVVFEEVKKSHSILFFDEADAIFGKRTEQKDSNDRFANLQTSYLLQRFEDYEGIVILATNYIQNFDEAFLRRIKFKVDFPFPDAQYRKKIWGSLLIPEAPFEELDLAFLSDQFELSGSAIKNIVVNAAFLAASEGKRISMTHMIASIRNEYNKSNKIILKEELKEYDVIYTQTQKDIPAHSPNLP